MMRDTWRRRGWPIQFQTIDRLEGEEATLVQTGGEAAELAERSTRR